MDKVERVRELGPALTSADGAARDAALAELESLYVSSADGRWVTDAEVARVALPLALAALEHADAAVRVTGAFAARLLASDGEAAVAALARRTEDADPSVRLAALEALGEFGARAAPAAGRVAERLARAEAAGERAAAAYTLGNCGEAGEHAGALVDQLIGDEPLVQAGAAYALSLALEDERVESRERASQALRRLSRRDDQ